MSLMEPVNMTQATWKKRVVTNKASRQRHSQFGRADIRVGQMALHSLVHPSIRMKDGCNASPGQDEVRRAGDPAISDDEPGDPGPLTFNPRARHTSSPGSGIGQWTTAFMVVITTTE